MSKALLLTFDFCIAKYAVFTSMHYYFEPDTRYLPPCTITWGQILSIYLHTRLLGVRYSVSTSMHYYLGSDTQYLTACFLRQCCLLADVSSGLNADLYGANNKYFQSIISLPSGRAGFYVIRQQKK